MESARAQRAPCKSRRGWRQRRRRLVEAIIQRRRDHGWRGHRHSPGWHRRTAPAWVSGATRAAHVTTTVSRFASGPAPGVVAANPRVRESPRSREAPRPTRHGGQPRDDPRSRTREPGPVRAARPRGGPRCVSSRCRESATRSGETRSGRVSEEEEEEGREAKEREGGEGGEREGRGEEK
ncbi:unnamed protein product [Lampetra fluviatilis]